MAAKRCYLASPLGFTESGRHYYQEVLLPTLAEHVHVLDPWNLITPDEYLAAIENGQVEELALEIGRNNERLLNQAQMLVAVLDGQEVDAGVAAEVGYAAAKKIPCFGLRTDLRESGEYGVSVNLQVEAFILESGGSLSHSLQELIDSLQTQILT